MTRSDVANLVAEHGDQLGLGVQVGEDAAGDVDVAARQGEGVHVLAVENREGVLEFGTVADGRDTLADVVHVSLQGLVLVTAVLLQDLRVHLPPDLDLFGLAHQDHVRAARGGIGCASRQDRPERRDRGEQGDSGCHRAGPREGITAV